MTDRSGWRSYATANAGLGWAAIAVLLVATVDRVPHPSAGARSNAERNCLDRLRTLGDADATPTATSPAR